MLPPGEPSALGLREPKKARTRPTIQQHALRLFRERGYEATWCRVDSTDVELRATEGFPASCPCTAECRCGRGQGSIMDRTIGQHGRSERTASRWPGAGIIASYAASFVAFAHAMVDLYWALGGHSLLSTVGGYAEHLARQGGVLPELLALSATAAQVAGGLLALALVRPWGHVVPRVVLVLGSAGASALLVLYGGITVLVGALVLTGVIHPSGGVDWTAMRWHTGVWDMWFLVWGILLALASAGYWRRTHHR